MNPKNIQGRNSYVQQSFLTKHHLSQISRKEKTDVKAFVTTRQKSRERAALDQQTTGNHFSPARQHVQIYYFACRIIKRILTVAMLSSYI